MQYPPRIPTAFVLATALAVFTLTGAKAQEDYEKWAPLQTTFESTGGGGIMIGEYRPVVMGDKCVTNFTATEPGGKVYYNIVEFTATPVQGGTLCADGKWRAVDGSASGTTPLRVFIKDGVARRSP
jgi:hypothetical protein